MITAVLGLFHLQLHHLLFLVLPLPDQLTIWSNDVRCVKRGRGKSCKFKGLREAGAAARGLAAVALVGEGGHQGEDETEDGTGKAAKDEIVAIDFFIAAIIFPSN